MSVTPRRDSEILDELEANRQSRRNCMGDTSASQILGSERRQNPDDLSFEAEGEAIESELKRTIESRDTVMCSLIQAVYRFRDATLVDQKKADCGSALQNLYRELERAEELVGPS
jgi:hypothetical protein